MPCSLSRHALVLATVSLLLSPLLLSVGCTDDPLPGQNSADSNGAAACELGERTCLNEQKLRTCTLSAGQTRYVEVDCGGDEVCQDDDCVPRARNCEDRCQPPQTRCTAEGAETCADHDGDGCNEYGGAVACAQGESCDAVEGLCKATNCTDSCTESQTSCEDDLITTCVRGADSCLSFGAGKECPEGQSCQGGECVTASGCEDECEADTCTADGLLVSCTPGAEGCTTLGEPSACGAGQTCRSGGCVAAESCTDACIAGETVCVSDQLASCEGQANGCLAIPTPSDCPSGQTCSSDGGSARCVAPPTSGPVVLNEIFYDALGDDLRGSGAQAESPTFVELHGPAGLDISGYVLELVNGSGGATYGTITLPGGTQLDGNGFAVIASQTPDNFLGTHVGIYTQVVYELPPYANGQDGLQNGPDAVRLKDTAGAVIDALAYGPVDAAFGAGEGSPAPDVLSGRSLGRDASSADSDDNAADWVSQLPTPGLPNGDLVINELYVDQPGTDTGTDTFVELMAPIVGTWEDVPLDGYVLHAINGYNGDDYLLSGMLPGIEMSSTRLYDSGADDGYVVVCNINTASSSLLARCGVPFEGVDFQNGPDSFVLTYNGRTIDAVAYGTFGTGTFPAGEGSPAPFSSANSGKSLARQPITAPGPLDTDDNATDFHLVDPTPGQENPLRTP